MVLLNVSIEKNGVYQARLYKMTKENNVGPDDIVADVESKGGKVLGIKIATADDMRPGKPVIDLQEVQG